MGRKSLMVVMVILILFGVAVFVQSAPAVYQAGESKTVQKTMIKSGSNIPIQIIVLALGGFFGWILMKVVGLFVLRKRLLGYLIVVLNNHLKENNENYEFLKEVKSKRLIAGKVIKWPVIYTKSELEDLKCMHDQCFRLLTKHELIKLLKCVNVMWVIEALFDGFCTTFTQYCQENKALDKGKVDYLNRKINRIESYIKIFPQNIEKIDQLPVDYAGTIQAKTMVRSDEL